MKTQFKADRAGVVRLLDGAPLRIDRQAGELSVVHGRVWVTRPGDVDDHVLEAGQTMRLDAVNGVVLEQWRRNESVVMHWYPRPSALSSAHRDAAAYAWRFVALAAGGAARGLHGAQTRFDAIARSAAALAKRAQGRITADPIRGARTVQ